MLSRDTAPDAEEWGCNVVHPHNPQLHAWVNSVRGRGSRWNCSRLATEQLGAFCAKLPVHLLSFAADEGHWSPLQTEGTCGIAAYSPTQPLVIGAITATNCAGKSDGGPLDSCLA